MILITPIEITGSIPNPDKLAIEEKSLIDISISEYDISASGYSTTLKLNYDRSEIVLLNDADNDDYDTYYTPLYTEKINYDTWKNTINKSFNELGLE